MYDRNRFGFNLEVIFMSNVKVIANTETGDWLVVEVNNQIIFSGHNVLPLELVEILQAAGVNTEFVELNSDEMERQY